MQAILHNTYPTSQQNIANHPLFDDNSISHKAKNIASQISKKQASFTMQALLKESKEGRDSIYNGMRELIRKKYVKRVQPRTLYGKFTHTQYIIKNYLNKLKLTKKGSPNNVQPISHTQDALNQCIELWKTYPILPKHTRLQPHHKTYKRALVLIDHLLKTNTLDEIKDAITTYAWFVDQPCTFMRASRPWCVRIDEFFKFSYTCDHLRSKPNHKLRLMQSWFDECKKGSTYLVDTYGMLIKDDHANVTKMIIEDIIKSEAFPTLKSEKDLTPLDRNTFIKAGKKLFEFVEKYRKGLPEFLIKAYDECSVRMRMFFDTKDTKYMHPGILITDEFWREYAWYMKDRGVVYTGGMY